MALKNGELASTIINELRKYECNRQNKFIGGISLLNCLLHSLNTVRDDFINKKPIDSIRRDNQLSTNELENLAIKVLSTTVFYNNKTQTEIKESSTIIANAFSRILGGVIPDNNAHRLSSDCLLNGSANLFFIKMFNDAKKEFSRENIENEKSIPRGRHYTFAVERDSNANLVIKDEKELESSKMGELIEALESGQHLAFSTFSGRIEKPIEKILFNKEKDMKNTQEQISEAYFDSLFKDEDKKLFVQLTKELRTLTARSTLIEENLAKSEGMFMRIINTGNALLESNSVSSIETFYNNLKKELEIFFEKDLYSIKDISYQDLSKLQTILVTNKSLEKINKVGPLFVGRNILSPAEKLLRDDFIVENLEAYNKLLGVIKNLLKLTKEKREAIIDNRFFVKDIGLEMTKGINFKEYNRFRRAQQMAKGLIENHQEHLVELTGSLS